MISFSFVLVAFVDPAESALEILRYYCVCPIPQLWELVAYLHYQICVRLVSENPSSDLLPSQSSIHPQDKACLFSALVPQLLHNVPKSPERRAQTREAISSASKR
ncbi:hypothetical protein B0T21DRAFT_369231 [Apiosordaria backusii]|uniref:Secreted protein n=1 Tax=Apiosordaria backusii TaxID=314023 RepID=A0AA40E8V3_9PEZI|nr:hypothetical protein B0T21DRAFT_369231 [Apiosordaria backusii]